MARLLAGLMLAVPLLSGCAYKEYDPNRPNDYYEFWKDEENRKNSLLYPLTSECRDAGGCR